MPPQEHLPENQRWRPPRRRLRPAEQLSLHPVQFALVHAEAGAGGKLRHRRSQVDAGPVAAVGADAVAEIVLGQDLLAIDGTHALVLRRSRRTGIFVDVAAEIGLFHIATVCAGATRNPLAAQKVGIEQVGEGVRVQIVCVPRCATHGTFAADPAVVPCVPFGALRPASDAPCPAASIESLKAVPCVARLTAALAFAADPSRYEMFRMLYLLV